MTGAASSDRRDEAQAAWERGDRARARALYEAYVAAAPEDTEALFALGVICLHTDDLDGADRRFAEYLTHHPGHANASEYLREVGRRRPRAPTSEAVLRVDTGAHAGEEHGLPAGGETVIGRSVEARIRLERDTDVSRRHAAIRRSDDGEWMLRDLGSANGTWLDGQRLRGEARIADGQRFSVGHSSLRMEHDRRAPTTPSRPAAAPEDEPPYQPTLPNPLVIGHAAFVQLRHEVDQNRLLTAFQPNLAKQTTAILTLRVLPPQRPPLGVELRGRMIAGALPRDGDWIAVPDVRHKGALRVSELQSLETGEIVHAQDAPVLAKAMFGAKLALTALGFVIALAFIALIWSQLLPRLLDGS